MKEFLKIFCVVLTVALCLFWMNHLAVAKVPKGLGEDAYLKILDDEKVHIQDRIVAARRLANRWATKKSVPVARKYVLGPYPVKLRFFCIHILGLRGGEANLDIIVKTLRDPEAAIQVVSIRALGKIGSIAGFPYLKQKLLGVDSPEKVLAACLTSLADIAIKNPQIKEETLKIIRDHRKHDQKKVRKSARVSLQRLGY